MTAELTDERLAELITQEEQLIASWQGRALVMNPEASERAKQVYRDRLACLRELQAYRAKRETHVWVPKVPTEAMIAAAESAYMSQPKPMLPWADAYRAMLDARETDNV